MHPLRYPGGIVGWILFFLFALLYGEAATATFMQPPHDRIAPRVCYMDHHSIANTLLINRNRRCNLMLMEDDAKKNRRNGVYVRPSAAIERGSGFFVPGLEGFKVRILVGCVVVLFTIFNHWYDQQYIISEPGSSLSMSGNLFAESLAIVYGLLVLLQGTIEARKESLSAFVSPNDSTVQANTNVKLLQQQWSIENSDQTIDWRLQVEWAASTFLSLTPATNMMLIGPGKVVFSLGTQPRKAVSDEEEALGCSAALATLAQSTSGRVSLPMNHVSVQSLIVSTMDSIVATPRCAVLQRIDDQLCWLMTSDQLLVAFTPNDLQWLGQLAKYVNPVQ